MAETIKPVITTLAWVPPFAAGFVRDIRARWALGEIGEDYELELIDGRAMKQQPYLARQPFGQVPVYRDEAGEIFESGAIALRIAERGPGLLPADPGARGRATQWVIAALNSVEPWIMQLVACDVFEAKEPWSAMRRPKVVADLQARLAALEASLGEKTWLDGDAFTVGDLMMVSVLGGLRGTDMLAGYPMLAAYVARGEARPAHEQAMADQLALYAETPAPASA